jgi:hypothetical protein
MLINAAASIAILLSACYAADPSMPSGSKVFVESTDGFDIYLTKAIETKHVPLTVVADRAKADFIISATSSQTTKTTLAQGINEGLTGKKEHPSAIDEAAIKITNKETGEIIYTYEGHKVNAVRGKRSMAEDVAKHLNDVISK